MRRRSEMEIVATAPQGLAHHSGDLAGGARLAEIVPLDLVASLAAPLAQSSPLFRLSSSTTFRRKLCAIAMTAWAIAMLSTSSGISSTKERSIFTLSIGKRLRYASDGIAGAEIVDRHVDSEILQPSQHVHRLLGVLHEHALGDLELQIRRFQPGFSQRCLDVIDQAFVGELAWRQVDRTRNRRSPAAATSGSARTPSSAPSADRAYQASLLRDRNELVRRDQPHLRMLPAQQRLHSADPPRREVHLGLVMQPQFVALQHAAQRGFQRQALAGNVVDLRRIELVVVPSPSLWRGTARSPRFSAASCRRPGRH